MGVDEALRARGAKDKGSGQIGKFEFNSLTKEAWEMGDKPISYVMKMFVSKTSGMQKLEKELFTRLNQIPEITIGKKNSKKD